MWSTVALNISPPSSRCAAFVRARFFRSLFISGPSEPPRLITVAYMPSDPSAPFQLAARMRGKPGEQRKKKKTKKQGVGTQTTPRAHVFFFTSPSDLPRVPAALSRREIVRAAEENSAAAVKSCSSTSLPTGKRAQAGRAAEITMASRRQRFRMRADSAAARFGFASLVYFLPSFGEL